MRKFFAALFLIAVAALAANFKLYLKDGTYHIVREYKVEADRVRFYSVERSGWEEIPLSMADLKRTETEAAAHQAELDKDAKALSEEEAAAHEARKETSRIPQDPGVYWLDGDQTKVLKVAECTIHMDKRRTILERLTPIPMVDGKATLEIDGAHSQNVFTDPEQVFYFQPSETERFGIAKLTVKGAVRIVENLTYQSVTKEVTEEPVMVEILQQQLTSGELYKIWPQEKLEPGEYAVVEYTANKLNIQVWDFAIKAAKR